MEIHLPVFISKVKKIWPWLRRAALVIAVYFLVQLVTKNIHQFRSTVTAIHLGWLGAGVLMSGLGFFVSSLAWRAMLVAQGATITTRQSWWLSTYSFLFRYLPGGVPGVAARVGVMRQLGIRVSHGSWNTLLEMGLSASIAALIFYLGGWGHSIPPWLNILIIAGMTSGLVVIILLILPAPAIVQWRERLRLPSMKLWPTIVTIFWFLASWLTLGVGHWFLLLAMGLQHKLTLLSVTGLYAFSWVAGLVAVFTPSGLGVREATMIGFLEPVIGPSAVVFAILSRLIFTVGELLNLGVAFLFRPRSQSPKNTV